MGARLVILKAARAIRGAWTAVVQESDLSEEEGTDLAQPYGVHFQPKNGAIGALLGTDDSGADPVIPLDHRDNKRPTKKVSANSGGLYSEGRYQVFVDRDGLVVLNGDLSHGSDASDGVAVGSAVLAELTALRESLNDLVTAYNGHGHGGNGAAAPVPTAGKPAEVGAVTSTTVKIPSEV